jgi:hypothetical protein
MTTTTTTPPRGIDIRRQRLPVCVECSRVFDLMDEEDAQEWFYGHDCEA